MRMIHNNIIPCSRWKQIWYSLRPRPERIFPSYRLIYISETFLFVTKLILYSSGVLLRAFRITSNTFHKHSCLFFWVYTFIQYVSVFSANTYMYKTLFRNVKYTLLSWKYVIIHDINSSNVYLKHRFWKKRNCSYYHRQYNWQLYSLCYY